MPPRRALPLSLLLLASCPAGDDFDGQVEIFFRAQSMDDLLVCDDPNPTDDLADLRLYIHDIRLINAAGDDYPVELIDDGAYQGDGVVLLDFEDASGECRTTPGLNKTIRGTVDRDGGPYTALRFRVGVPPALDFVTPAERRPPLAEPTMFNYATGGHLFLSAAGWFGAGLAGVQLFATDCTGLGEAITCARPNSPEIFLDEFDLDASAVVIDMRQLFGGMAGSCASSPFEPLCLTVFPRIGLDPATGIFQKGQQAFRLE